VDALFGLQVAVGVLPPDLDRDRLDARLFPGEEIQDGHFEPMALRPADIHPHEHLGPVLGLGTARAGVNGQQGIPRVLRSLQHGLELECLRGILDLLGLPGQLGLERLVRLGLEELCHFERSTKPMIQIVVGSEPVLESLDLLYGCSR
jgi:hypothetical protein